MGVIHAAGHVQGGHIFVARELHPSGRATPAWKLLRGFKVSRNAGLRRIEVLRQHRLWPICAEPEPWMGNNAETKLWNPKRSRVLENRWIRPVRDADRSSRGSWIRKRRSGWPAGAAVLSRPRSDKFESRSTLGGLPPFDHAGKRETSRTAIPRCMRRSTAFMTAKTNASHRDSDSSSRRRGSSGRRCGSGRCAIRASCRKFRGGYDLIAYGKKGVRSTSFRATPSRPREAMRTLSRFGAPPRRRLARQRRGNAAKQSLKRSTQDMEERRSIAFRFRSRYGRLRWPGAHGQEPMPRHSNPNAPHSPPNRIGPNAFLATQAMSAARPRTFQPAVGRLEA